MNETNETLGGDAIWVRLGEILAPMYYDTFRLSPPLPLNEAFLRAVNSFPSDEDELLLKCLLPLMQVRGFPSWRISRISVPDSTEPYQAGFQEGLHNHKNDETYICTTAWGERPLIAAVRAADQALRLLEAREAQP